MPCRHMAGTPGFLIHGLFNTWLFNTLLLAALPGLPPPLPSPAPHPPGWGGERGGRSGRAASNHVLTNPCIKLSQCDPNQKLSKITN